MKHMRRTLLLPALAAIGCVQAQQINGYRYWFDDIETNAVTTAVAATPELVLAANWPTTGLQPGYHRVTVQVRDSNGDWSVPVTSVFTRSASNIAGYRFWVNDDLASITTGSIGPDDAVNLNGVIDPGSLPRDYNTVTIQFRDADGEWSVPVSTWFVKNTGAVNGYEYWIDEAIDDRASATIGPAVLVDLINDLPVPTTDGEHVFTIRFSSVNGTWSVPLSATFSFAVGVAELPGLSNLLVFPSPATAQLGLRLNSDAGRTLQLEVVDLAGQRVLDLGSWAVAGSTWRNWDISGLASGAYLLRVTGEKSTWNTRFVKQ